MSRTWIKVKRGILEKKHRDAMGSAIWLFLYILDIVEWENGTIVEWTDDNHAEIFGIPVRTLKEHRQKLYDEGYITCIQKRHSQTIVVQNYTNPKEYSGEIYNLSEEHQNVPIKPKALIKDVPPTSNPHLKIKRTEINELREAFCKAAQIAPPDWNDLDAGERRALGAAWTRPLKLYWKLAGKDVLRAKETIIRATKGASFDIATPRSIQNIFSSYLNRKDSRDGIKRASSTPK